MALIDETYVTVAKAADLLKVSRSTLWRWIRQGAVPAHRLGYRRVLLKQEDLGRMITPARGEKTDVMLQKEKERLARPLTKSEQEKGLAALRAAERLSAELATRQGGNPFPDSVEIIREMRDERMRHLS